MNLLILIQFQPKIDTFRSTASSMENATSMVMRTGTGAATFDGGGAEVVAEGTVTGGEFHDQADAEHMLCRFGTWI
jgi:hypothetical protein